MHKNLLEPRRVHLDSLVHRLHLHDADNLYAIKNKLNSTLSAAGNFLYKIGAQCDLYLSH